MNQPNLPRRQFLGRFAPLAALPFATGMLPSLQRAALAANFTATDYKALVCLFMYGGNDSNNLIVPTDATRYGQYNAARGRLALSQSDLLGITDSATGQAYGLHPQLGEIRQLWQQGRATVIANAGPLVEPATAAEYRSGTSAKRFPNNLYSHSDQQFQWQSASADGSLRTGWGGRVADLVNSANGPYGAINTSLALSGRNTFQTGASTTSFSLSAYGRFGFDVYPEDRPSDPINQGFKRILSLQRTHFFEQAWLEVMNRAIDSQRVFYDATNMAQPYTTEFPGSNLGNQLRMVARLIAARAVLGVKRQVFFVSLGGFDTHGEDQLADQANLFSEISTAVGAFYNAMVEMGIANNVTLFSASDFSRNLPVNGSGGSDHGWGSHHFAVGGAVQGGRLYGRFPALAVNGPDDAGEGTWVPTTSVDQYAATLAAWFGVSAADVASLIAPNIGRFATANLGFV